jgi:hypothetical protein
MKRLQREIERIVGPLYASEWRKNRMREELLAHWSRLYDEELARVRDENRALDAARARFGDAAEISRTLQQSVPLVERVLFVRLPGGGWIERRADESAVGHILRVARWQVAWMTAANAGLVVVIAAIGQFVNRRPLPEKPPLANVAAFLGVCTLVNAVVVVAMPLGCEWMRRHADLYRVAARAERHKHACIVLVLVVSLAALGAGAAAAVAGLFEPLLGIPIVDITSFWLVVGIAGLVTLPLVIIQAWQQADAARRFEACCAADLDAAE